MNVTDILDMWAHDYLVPVFPSLSVMSAYFAILAAVILVIMLKYQKRKYGRIWMDEDEVPKALSFAAGIGMAIFVFPITVALALIALIVWVFTLVVNKAFKD